MTGRRTLLTEDRAQRIYNAVTTGNSLKAAAEHAGISEATFHGWILRGRTERARQANLLPTDDTDPEPDTAQREAIYLDFLERVEAARAAAEVQAVAIIRQAMSGWDEVTTVNDQHVTKDGDIVATVRTSTVRRFSWQAAAWWLERTRPSEYGRYVRTEVTGADGAPLVSSPDELRERARQLVTDELAEKRAQRELPSGNGHVADTNGQ